MDPAYCDYKGSVFDRPGRMMNVAGVSIERRRIQDYFTPEYWDCLEIWQRCRKHGLPWADLGWAETPAHIVDIVDLFDDIYDAHRQVKEPKHASGGRVKGFNKGRSPRR